MKKTAVLSAVALAIGLGSATSGFAADNRIGDRKVVCHEGFI